MLSDVGGKLLTLDVATFTKERVQEIIKQVTESDSFKAVGSPYPRIPRVMMIHVLVGVLPKHIRRFFKGVAQKQQVIPSNTK